MRATLTLVVMAAGIGNRYGGLKQVDSFGPGGEVLMEYSVYDALKAGYDRVVFVIRKDFEKLFRDKIGRTIERAVDTAYVFQSLDQLPAGFSVPEGRTKPWGTGQAILVCKEAVTSPFTAINADDFYGRSTFAIMAAHLRRDSGGDGRDYAMVGYRLENTLSQHGHVARGVCEATPDGYLVNVRELLRVQKFPEGIKFTDNGNDWFPLAPDALTSMNFWGFGTSLFPELEARFPEFLKAGGSDALNAEFLIPEIVGALVREGRARVKILPTQDRWFGITYPDDRPVVKAEILERVRQRIYPARLWSGD